MLRTLSTFFQHQADAARDYFSDAMHRGNEAASDVGRTAMSYARDFRSAPADTIDAVERRLRAYGITPDMLASLSASQLKRIQRLAVTHAPRHAGSIAGPLLALGLVAAIVYVLTRAEDVAAPAVVRSKAG
ncbi:hypothetical protein E8L99_18250 [Phreatobacter aquaticus]|uniref:Uncharacterized protein n=1 Tax=Phreatobacter aquaticus TaxID=2570229 RepID=A0A4D7QM12_9HYPH|nr:hypothetical protein [Phreatobacter aquaticus]QCK87561.1 hypothetical protein E8L99_18250 [Phreatobacter aquaticus]